VYTPLTPVPRARSVRAYVPCSFNRFRNMNTQITVRHVDVTDHVKEYAEKRAAKLEKFYDGIVSAHIILGEDNSPAQDKQVEINIDVYQKRLTAENSASTYEQAVNSCVDQLRRQLEKYKSQLRSKKRDAH